MIKNNLKTKIMNYIKRGTVLSHTKSGVKFNYIGEFKSQFTSQIFVELFNIKTGKIETFQKSTYLQYFE